jgi:hypothetical protein
MLLLLDRKNGLVVVPTPLVDKDNRQMVPTMGRIEKLISLTAPLLVMVEDTLIPLRYVALLLVEYFRHHPPIVLVEGVKLLSRGR